jgi:hypothetical protein
MGDDPVIVQVCQEYESFTLFDDEERKERNRPADPFTHYCEASKRYWRYVDKVLNTYVRGTTDPMRLAQARMLITDRYIEERDSATTGHRDKLGSKHHVCLYQVWLAGFHEILTVHRDLDPPRVLKVVMRKSEPTLASGSYAMLPPAVFLGKWEE